MLLDEYQDRAKTTAVYPKELGAVYPTIGLASEAGEALNVAKRHLRSGRIAISHDTREALIEEAGDVLWYVAILADELGISLSTLARENLDKLQLRKERGELKDR